MTQNHHVQFMSVLVGRHFISFKINEQVTSYHLRSPKYTKELSSYKGLLLRWCPPVESVHPAPVIISNGFTAFSLGKFFCHRSYGPKSTPFLLHLAQKTRPSLQWGCNPLRSADLWPASQDLNAASAWFSIYYDILCIYLDITISENTCRKS